MKTFKQTLIAILFAGTASTSFAAGFPVNIYGNFTTNSHVGNVASSVNGNNSRADINVGGIQGSANIMGGFNTTVQAGNISSTVQGNNSTASINIGGIQSYPQ